MESPSTDPTTLGLELRLSSALLRKLEQDPESLSLDEWEEVHRAGLRSLAPTDSVEGVAAYGELVHGYRPEPHHLEMLSVMIDAVHTKQDTLILMPAGSAKTTWGNTIFLSHRIAIERDIRVGLFSQAKDFADAFSSAIMATYEGNEEHRKLFGNLSNGGKWTLGGWHRKGSRWAESKDFTLFAGGTGGQVASKRFSLMVADDILGMDNTQTADQREKTRIWYDQSLDPRIVSDGVRIVFGTRWADGDLYETLGTSIEEGGYGFRTHVIQALIYDPGPDVSVYDPETGDPILVRRDGFRSYWEKVWPVEKLLAMRLKNPAVFDCVYMQDIGGLLSGDVFQKEWFQWYGTRTGDPDQELPEAREYTRRMGVDFAFSVKERADYTARVTTAEDREGNYFVMRAFRDKIDVDHAGFVANGFIEFPGIGAVKVEENQAQSAIVAEILRDYSGIPIIGYRADTDKRTRAKAVAEKVRGRKMWLHESLRDGWLYRECLSFPKGHDDGVDALGYSMDLGSSTFFFGGFRPKSPRDRIREQLMAGLPLS